MNDAKLAVLFVHGIQGQPKQFQFLTDALPSSVEGRAILLPGHGKTAREFHAVGRADWQAAVRKETEALLAQGKRVLYVGHSMGCLLGLSVSRELGAPYAGMLLLGCPFRIRFLGRFVGDPLRSIGRKREEDPRDRASREGNSVPTEGLGDLLRILHPYAELMRLVRQERRAKPRLPERVRFFFSGNDEIVSLRSSETAGEWPHAEIRVLEGCGHCYFTDAAIKTLRAALLDLIAEVQS